MKYTLPTGKVISIPDEEIEKLQNKLKISKEEAIHTYLVDNDYESDEIVEELTKKAKENHITGSIHKAKAENKEKRSKKTREKKENPLKKQIIAGIHDYFLDEIGHTLPKNTTISIRNDEKYIDLVIDGVEFTINLVQHRKKD